MVILGRAIRAAAVGAIAVCATSLVAGCWTTEEIDQTMPPYASSSDAGRDPASAPTPTPQIYANSETEEPQGIVAKTGHAIATVALFPFRMIADAVEWIF